MQVDEELGVRLQCFQISPCSNFRDHDLWPLHSPDNGPVGITRGATVPIDIPAVCNVSVVLESSDVRVIVAKVQHVDSPLRGSRFIRFAKHKRERVDAFAILMLKVTGCDARAGEQRPIDVEPQPGSDIWGK